ncbi:hypothetical protein D3C71_1770780 [compost metagenome]
MLQLSAKQLAAGMAAAQVAQQARHYRPVAPGIQIGLTGQLVRRTALQVGQGIGIQALLGITLIIAGGDQIGRDRAQGFAQGHLSPPTAAAGCDRCRSG